MMTRRDFGRLAAALPFLARTPAAMATPDRGPPSDHFDSERFFNPGGVGPRGLGDLLR